MMSCGVKSAQKTIEGDWDIVYYYTELNITCTGQFEIISSETGNDGSATFTEDRFEINIPIRLEDTLCTLDSVLMYSGAWEIAEKKRQLTGGVYFNLLLDDQIWNLIFSNGESGYKQPNGKDVAFIKKGFSNTEYIFIEMKRS